MEYLATKYYKMQANREYNVPFWTQQEQFYLKRLEEEDQSRAAMNHIGLAGVYDIMSRFDDCVLQCNKVLEISKSDFEIAEAHIWMGRAHQGKKEFNPAIAHYLQAFGIDEEHNAAIEGLGKCYSELKDYANAEYWFHKLEEIEGCEDSAWMMLADLFYETKDFDRSMSYYEKYLGQSPANIEAMCGIGRCLAGKKLFTESIEAFNKVAGLHPNEALPQYYLGMCYQSIEDQYRAMHHYMKAIELDPAFAEAYNNVGKLYADFDGNYKTAIEYLEKALVNLQNAQLQQMLYINLARLNGCMANFERRDYYKNKILEALGFGFNFLDEGDEEDI